MIQDIYPSKLDNGYKNLKMEEDDIALIFDDEGRILIRDPEDSSDEKGTIAFLSGEKYEDAIYLFSLDDKRYFLVKPRGLDKSGSFYSIRDIRDRFYGKEIFVVFTAYHLWKWYSENIFCGKCGHPLSHDDKERALKCSKCGNMVYPRINPAVIVGVTKGDSILVTRYRRGYAHNALVAGFTEIGETLEETVAREVMEETGIRVKNIRYYKSQPWGMAQDILTGFFCEAEGDDDIRMDESELKYAQWVKRDDIVLQPNDLSLTNEMMKVFKNGGEGR